MKTIHDAFPEGIEDIQRYAPDVDAHLVLDSLTASYYNAYLRISNVIGSNFVDDCLNDTALRLPAQGALANYTIYEQLPYLYKGRDVLYKYQYEELKNKYISNAWTFINALITALDNGTSYNWHASDCYLSRQNLLFSDQNEFDRYCAIDRSAYFFSKIVFLIRDESRRFIPKRISRERLVERPSLDEALKYYIAYRVMARAVVQFDVAELPAPVRMDINHEFTKYGNAGESKKQLFDYLNEKASEYADAVETEFQKMHKTFAAGAIDNPNKESNKYYRTR